MSFSMVAAKTDSTAAPSATTTPTASPLSAEPTAPGPKRAKRGRAVVDSSPTDSIKKPARGRAKPVPEPEPVVEVEPEPVVEVKPEPVKPEPKVKKDKVTFMLHEPDTMRSVGKYMATDYRYAALKVATQGHKRILLRKTNSKEIYEYNGDVIRLDTPKIITRGSRPITYEKKPTVKFVRKFIFANATEET